MDVKPATMSTVIDHGPAPQPVRHEAVQAERNAVMQAREEQEKAVMRQQAMQQAEDYLSRSGLNDRVRMYYDKEIKQVVIQVLDGASMQVVKQIPSEDMVEFFTKFERYIGSIVNKEV
jgi:uncharacterized FlaG/YvyC family protein